MQWKPRYSSCSQIWTISTEDTAGGPKISSPIFFNTVWTSERGQPPCTGQKLFPSILHLYNLSAPLKSIYMDLLQLLHCGQVVKSLIEDTIAPNEGSLSTKDACSWRSPIHALPAVSGIHFESPKEVNLLTKDN